MTEVDKLMMFEDKYKALATIHTIEFSTGELDKSNTDVRWLEYNQDKSQCKCKCGKDFKPNNPRHTNCNDCYGKQFDKCLCGN